MKHVTRDLTHGERRTVNYSEADNTVLEYGAYTEETSQAEQVHEVSS